MKLKQLLSITLIIDLGIHLLVFRPMASHINNNGFSGLSMWTQWFYKLLFEGYTYPTMALEPAYIYFGEGWINLFIKPYLLIFFLLLLGKPLLGMFSNVVALVFDQIVRPSLLFIVKFTTIIFLYGIVTLTQMFNWLFSRKDNGLPKASFASFWKRRKFIKPSFSGFSIGSSHSISAKDAHTGMIVVGRPGSGKSTITAYTSLLRSNYHSWVITDPSEELYKTSGYLKMIGYNILRFSVTDLESSCRFNPLLRCSDTNQVAKLAETLIKMAYTSTKGDDSYWTSSAKRLLKCFLVAVKNLPEEQAHLPNAYRLLSEYAFHSDKIEEFVFQNVDDNTRAEFKGICAANEKEFSSFLSTAQTALEKFGGDAKIAWLVSGDTLDFNLLREEPTALYLQFPELDLPYYAPLINILTTQLMDFCMQKKETYDRSVFFMLEEVGILRINNLDLYLSQLRKYNAGVLLILQHLDQLVVQYGVSKASAILGAVNHWVFFGGLTHETCKQVESMLGLTTVKDEYEHHQKRPLMFADEVRMLPENTVLYLSSNRHPVRMKVKPYYKNRRLKNRIHFGLYEVKKQPLHPINYIDITTLN